MDRSLVRGNLVQRMLTIPCRVIGALAVHTFGLRIIYPGSLSILHMMLCKYRISDLT